MKEQELQELRFRWEQEPATNTKKFVIISWLNKYDHTKAKRDMAMSEVRKQENGMAKILSKIEHKVRIFEAGENNEM